MPKIYDDDNDDDDDNDYDVFSSSQRISNTIGTRGGQLTLIMIMMIMTMMMMMMMMKMMMNLVDCSHVLRS